MNVPGNWEMNGFGDPEYVNNGFAWREHFNEQPPAVPTKDNHVGSYRRIIDILLIILLDIHTPYYYFSSFPISSSFSCIMNFSPSNLL